MTRSILAVISDLKEHVDVTPAESSTHVPIAGTVDELVACVAGRGPFDDVVSAMAAQLLAQRGVGSRRVPHAFASREMIAQLDLSSVKVVLASSLELTGAPAHVRYLMRRLRQRAPHAALIAGLWPAGEAVLTDVQVQKALGADGYVTSLREAIAASLAALGEPPAAPAVAAPTMSPDVQAPPAALSPAV
jgi:hypothetical protein